MAGGGGNAGDNCAMVNSFFKKAGFKFRIWVGNIFHKIPARNIVNITVLVIINAVTFLGAINPNVVR